MGARPRFRGVGEGQGGGVDDPVVADERDGDLDRLSHPAPPLPEGGDIRHHAQDALATSEGADGGDVSKDAGGDTKRRKLTHLYLYMVSASTSPNHTLRLGVKFCPVSSNMATSPPPFNFDTNTKGAV